MKERSTNIPTSSGEMETFICHPSNNGCFPAVVVYMDIWGIREELFDIARRVATVGYYCMVPNFYYRQGRISNRSLDTQSKMISLDLLSEEEQEIVRAPLRNLSDAMVVEDTGSLLEFIDRGEPVKAGAMGSIGYCMGGRHVFRVAERFPHRFKATVSLHGTELVIDQPDSVHLSKHISGELYCGFGEKDRFTPAPTINALQQSLSSSGVEYRYEIHPGADHGYALPDRDVYDKHAANRDWELIFLMFHRQIPPYSK